MWLCRYLLAFCWMFTTLVCLPAQDSKPADVNDSHDLEAFFDGVIPSQLHSRHVAGAVVSVVSGDKLVFSKGYGYCDVALRKPVDAEKTLFRIGSVSKPFTWTAVMQEVESGRIKLDDDINNYLGEVRIPATFPQPITMKHLLTHSPGMEDRVLGLFAKGPETKSLAELLRTQMPNRVRPAGEFSAYSNYGTALAGHAVATTAKLPWEEVIEQRILTPLGMIHTTLRQPAKEKLPEDMSKGYHWAGGQWQEKDFEYVPWAPAGAFSSTGSDMARFMLAHLNDGSLGKQTILKPESAKRMREPLFRHSDKVSPMGMGFIIEKHNDLTLVGHGGDTLWFHSMMQMIPEKKVGIFVSYNTDSLEDSRAALLQAFLQRYFPKPLIARPKNGDGSKERSAKYVGEYRTNRYSHSTFAKISSLMSPTNVALSGDGILVVSRGSRSMRMVEIEPGLYQEQDGTRTVAFREGPNGEIALLYDNVPIIADLKVSWLDSSQFHLILLLVSLGLLISAVLFWPAIGFNLRGTESMKIRRSGFSGFLALLGWLMAVACLALMAGFGLHLADSNEIIFGVPPLMELLMKLSYICAALVALTLLSALIAWLCGFWRITGRIHYSLVALAGVGFLWFLYYWNLMPHYSTLLN